MPNIRDMSDVQTISINLIDHETFKTEYPGGLSIDFTSLSDIAYCPTWGTIRRIKGLNYTSTTRKLALEFGLAFHQGASLIRCWNLWQRKLYEECRIALDRLFPEVSLEFVTLFAKDDPERAVVLCANESGFYDDPRDDKRTLSNLENLLLSYLHSPKLSQSDVYVEGDFIGIELPLSLHIQYTFNDGDKLNINYIGRIDGVETNGNQIYPVENKTASRTDHAWESGMGMSHQMTGYIIATELRLCRHIELAKVIGTQVPMPIREPDKGINVLMVSRSPWMRQKWLSWVLHNSQIGLYYADKVDEAPTYTHSCNRYFTDCPFIPICHSHDEEEFHDAMSELITDKWNPLEE